MSCPAQITVCGPCWKWGPRPDRGRCAPAWKATALISCAIMSATKMPTVQGFKVAHICAPTACAHQSRARFSFIDSELNEVQRCWLLLKFRQSGAKNAPLNLLARHSERQASARFSSARVNPWANRAGATGRDRPRCCPRKRLPTGTSRVDTGRDTTVSSPSS